MNLPQPEVVAKLKDGIQELQYVWCWDTDYYIPTLDALKTMVALVSVKEMQFLGQRFNCNDYALTLHANVVKVVAANRPEDVQEEGWFGWSFGRAAGWQFKSKKEKHQINICLTREGIYLIEPQTDEIWEYDASIDQARFVEM